ncbi:hypothetical protein [Haploplasma axanthum]|uniref:Uncharacterized protein n=1 Tax=Haploplasma axanthum TaxID=29552 RepID=A0A449BC52_HAPAX|nr:hypothetical protein [Haploplasma axanthum]VEU80024.1 Uncharacterised protein [Haploplasma axanthum]
MKKNEMEKTIKLRSEEISYKVAIFALAIWTLYESINMVINKTKSLNIPMYILIVLLCVQRFTEMYISKKMVDGDDEYKEPNKLLWTIGSIVIVVLLIVAIGITVYATLS